VLFKVHSFKVPFMCFKFPFSRFLFQGAFFKVPFSRFLSQGFFFKVSFFQCVLFQGVLFQGAFFKVCFPNASFCKVLFIRFLLQGSFFQGEVPFARCLWRKINVSQKLYVTFIKVSENKVCCRIPFARFLFQCIFLRCLFKNAFFSRCIFEGSFSKVPEKKNDASLFCIFFNNS